MNEIGVMLIEARKSQNLEIEQVSRETNIARDYIIALENDDYSVFPAEPYIVGFLRNYSDFLGLNSEEVVNLYKQVKIQELSVPPETLLPKKGFTVSKKTLTTILAVLIGVILLGVIYFLLTKLLITPSLERQADKDDIVKTGNQTEAVIEERGALTYEITESPFEKRLFETDRLKFTIEEKEYLMTISKISSSLTIKTNIGNQVIGLGESLKLDLNGDLVADAEITVEDIDKNNSASGVLVSVLTVPAIKNLEEEESADITVADESENNSTENYQVLFEGGSAYPVTLEATFRGYCLFRYEVDKTTREERYYQKAEQLTVQAKNGFRIWASNGNVVKLQLVAGSKNVNLDVSRPGEVIVKDLKWIRDDATKRYKFVVIDVD